MKTKSRVVSLKTKTEARIVVELGFAYDDAAEWIPVYGPGPASDVWAEFIKRFGYEVGQSLSFGAQNADRVYRVKNLDTGRDVLLLGAASTVRLQVMGEKAADGSWPMTEVPSSAQETLMAAAKTLIAERRSGLPASMMPRKPPLHLVPRPDDETPGPRNPKS